MAASGNQTRTWWLFHQEKKKTTPVPQNLDRCQGRYGVIKGTSHPENIINVYALITQVPKLLKYSQNLREK